MLGNKKGFSINDVEPHALTNVANVYCNCRYKLSVLDCWEYVAPCRYATVVALEQIADLAVLYIDENQHRS